jgi:hypothetical protein
MSEPEIARRCTACGASVREHAMFCPQCGNPITEASPTVAEALQPDPTATQPLSAVAPPATPRVHEDGVLARVEKIRKVSSIVIDQAAYDPSLRFLLVAAVLFVVFLVLLIFSKVIG